MSNIYHFLILVRTFKFYSDIKFQLYNLILTTKITMFYIRVSNFTHFITESLYSFINLYVPILQPLTTVFFFLLFYFCEVDFSPIPSMWTTHRNFFIKIQYGKGEKRVAWQWTNMTSMTPAGSQGQYQQWYVIW